MALNGAALVAILSPALSGAMSVGLQPLARVLWIAGVVAVELLRDLVSVVALAPALPLALADLTPNMPLAASVLLVLVALLLLVATERLPAATLPRNSSLLTALVEALAGQWRGARRKLSGGTPPMSWPRCTVICCMQRRCTYLLV